MQKETMKESFRLDLNQSKHDIKHIAGVSRGILQMIGVWPSSGSTFNFERLLARFLNIICYFLFGFILIPGFLHYVIREKNQRKRIKLMGPLMNCMIAVFKYSLLLFYADKIRHCINHMNEDWNKMIYDEDRKIVTQKAKIGRKLVILSMSFMYGGGLSYRTIVPLSRAPIITAQNLTIRALACPAYFIFFNEQQSPLYELVFIGQFFAGFAVYSVTCGVCGLAALLVMHICGQLKLSRLKMQNLVNGRSFQNDSIENRLADIVEHGIRVKGFLKQVEHVLQYICLIEIVGCSLLICICLYCVILEWEGSDAMAMLTYGVIMTSFGFCIFIFCYIGELLSDQASKVGAAACAIDWYRLPMKKARNLLLIISISNQQMTISAGKLIEMSLSSFSNIIKTSVAYFNILRRMIT